MSKELKALERVKNFMSNNAVHWKQDIGYIETALKALEIIKEKECLFKGLSELTQEEFDLLKEVLL